MVWREIISIVYIIRKIAYATLTIICVIILIDRIMQMIFLIIILAACIIKKIAWETLKIICVIISYSFNLLKLYLRES
jgi:hypothetical protein